MVLIPSLENFSSASGILNVGFLESMYRSVIDESFLGLGRIVTLHLQPIKQEDVNTQAQAPAAQYNPFFKRTPIPNTNTRNSGVKITPRDVQYHAHIKIGPMIGGKDMSGMGDLKANEAMITLAGEAIAHVTEGQCISVTIEGRRYGVTETRPIGFSTRKYIMVKLQEIQETPTKSPNPMEG
jgi:hypothetical protein